MLRYFMFLTIKGIFRDKVFRGILLAGCIFTVIPSISSLSMRQVTELSLTLSLSLISFILLLLSLFLGGTSLWRDMERRYTFSILGLPVTRTSYVLGRFLGIAGFLFLTAVVLGLVCMLIVGQVEKAYPPDRAVVWTDVVLAILFDVLKYVLLVSCALLLSTVSTSFFLPIFGTISVFFVGSAMQEAYEYVHSLSGATLSPIVRIGVRFLYYVLPNFSAFDLNVNAIYSVAPSSSGLLMTAGYGIIYLSIVLLLASIVYSKRELQ